MKTTIIIDIQYSSDDDKRHFEPYLDKEIERFNMALKMCNAGELTIIKN